MGREDDIKDALNRIRFCGSIKEFTRKYRKTFIKIDPKLKPTFWNILFTSIIDRINNDVSIRKRRMKKKRFRKDKLVESLEKFFKPINDNRKKTYYDIFKIKKIAHNYLIIINKLENSDTELKRKTRRNERNTNKFFAIYLDRDNGTVYIYNAEKFMIDRLFWWFNSKLKLRLEKLTEEKYTSIDVAKLLSQKNIKIYEIGLRHTLYSESDKIIIISRKGNGKRYLQKLKGELLENKEISIYDINHIKISYNKNRPVKIKFERKRGESGDINVLLKTHEKQILDLPPKIRKYVTGETLLYDKIDEKTMVSVLIHKEYIAKTEYYNPHFKKYIDRLEELGIITCKNVYRYWCGNPNCPFRSMTAMKTKKCRCGYVSDNRYTDYYDMLINHDKIIQMIGRAARRLGFSYRVIKKNYIGLKNPIIMRLSKDDKYYYILLNEKGLLNEEIEELKLIGLPIIIINLKGEIKSTLSNFHTIGSYELVYSLIKNDYDKIDRMLDNIDDRAHELKISSFKESLKRLGNNSKYSPHEFENIIFGIFNTIFPKCQKWGGKNLADGSFAIKYKKTKYIIWDAKRYDKASLLNYIKRKALIKDIKYIEAFNNNKIINKFGNLTHYLFVTSNTTQKEFPKISEEFKKQIKKIKTKSNLKKCNIACINRDEIIKLANFYDKNLNILINNHKFSKEIQKGFKSNNGYFLFEDVKKKLINIINEEGLFPKSSEIRKETKEFMEQK